MKSVNVGFFAICCLLCPLGMGIAAQDPQSGGSQGKGFPVTIRITEVKAEPAELDCSSKGAKTAVTVEAGFHATRPLNHAVVVIALYGYSSDPTGDRLDLTGQRQRVELDVSPAVAHFEAACGPDTVPGTVTIGAHIDSVPEGFNVQEPNPPEDGIARIRIKPGNRRPLSAVQSILGKALEGLPLSLRLLAKLAS